MFSKRHRLQSIAKSKEDKNRYKLSSNDNFRHLAYTQFVHWVNGRHSSGKHKRFVIPSCVVRRIKLEFPSPTGEYTGFKVADGHVERYFD